MIKDRKSRITIENFSYTQNANYGSDKTSLGSYSVWASVEQQSGSFTLDNLATKYSEVFRITKRHEVSRVVVPGVSEITYAGKTLTIHSVRNEVEGRKKEDIILAYTVN